MDPRTSSKVTAPDLLKAFREGIGTEPEGSDGEATARFYVILMDGENAVGKAHYHQMHAAQMLDYVQEHLVVPGRTVLVTLQVVEPEGWSVLAISAADE